MRGRTSCVAGAPNDVSYKNNTDIPSISIHYFLVVIEEILLFIVIGLMLRTCFEDDCYEHIPSKTRGR